MRLRFKLNIIFFSIVAIPMFFVSTLIFINAKQNHINEVKNKLDIVANLEGEKISLMIQNIKFTIQILQKRSFLRSNMPIVVSHKIDTQEYRKAKEKLDDQLIPWLKIEGGIIHDIKLVTHENKIVYTLNQEHMGKDIGGPLQDSLNLAFKHGSKGIYITEVFRNKNDNNRPILLVTGPVYDLEENFVGLIALEIDMTVIYKQLVNRTDLGSSGEIYLINKDRLMVSPSRFIPNAILNIRVETELAKNIFLLADHGDSIKKKSSEQYIPVYKDYRGIDVLGAHAIIPELQWAVLVEIDHKAALVPTDRLRVLSYSTTVIVLIFVMIIAFTTARAISRPINELQKGAEFIGKGNLDFKVGTQAKDEVGQLSRAFDAMIVGLKNVTASRDELSSEINERIRVEEKLEKHKAELENIVLDRTKELRKYQYNLEELVKERTTELEIKANEAQKAQMSLTYLVEDVNESRLELEDSNIKLEQANKELKAFSYSVSHDLRAPLRAIDGFTRILMEDYVSNLDAEAMRLGSVIQHNAQKMGKLIDDLLAFSRMGRSTMSFSEIDMKNMVNAIYHEVTDVEERKRIDFSIGDLPRVEGDTTMMRQVWINLISNAVKFSAKRERTVISVSCDTKEEELIYTIKDNGAGFNMKYKDKLFGVFQRLHGEKEFEGTGVGLALVQRIIQRHGGEIWAQSELDKGAVFFFSLSKKGSRSS